ncbi:MAG: hypothetical protein FJ086_02790 [Deltaproteobacteria bacterium]|nr:hypothetical protein [Deltaproteobacteria bacterium]
MRWPFAGLLCALGCVQVQEEVRVERGPVLRTWEQQVRLGRPQLSADATAALRDGSPGAWLRPLKSDTCREERLEQHAEERTVERSARGTGPALALGSVGTLAGVGLLLGAQVASDAPNRDILDAEGRYGASPRQLAHGWGWGALAVGVPAAVVAWLGHQQSGTTTQSTVQEVVTSAREQACHPAQVHGLVRVELGAGGFERRTEAGALWLSGAEVAAAADGTVLLDGQAVPLTQQAEDVLADVRACQVVLPVPSADGLGGLSAAQLDTRRQLAAACARRLPEGGAAEQAYAGALSAALEVGRRVRPPDGPALQSFEDVGLAYAPTLLAAEGTADALALSRGDIPPGQPVRLLGQVGVRGTVDLVEVVRPEGAVWVMLRGRPPGPEEQLVLGGEVRRRDTWEAVTVSLGELQVDAVVPPWAGWAQPLQPGADVELIAQRAAAYARDGTPVLLLEALGARSR